MSARFHDLTVKRVSPEAAGAVAITFDIPATERDSFAFEPGQFLTLRATSTARTCAAATPSAARAAAWPAGELEIGIRPVEGGLFSNWAAQSLKAGDQSR
jgi:ring-1,2-phenylacetyl-CoA epoxidase subunit PaaE